ncbi:bifunctional enzyme IspD/IspF [Striga asiatica]|uniref:Bifunctional enzyme IspD/IspF n=1 Tax=Striga asiatica TaxID=4170 RepID=A0A5A7PFE1_STRAF|nr:bifunctional enzyme IspD/IspF [Striga asiatica]
MTRRKDSSACFLCSSPPGNPDGSRRSAPSVRRPTVLPELNGFLPWPPATAVVVAVHSLFTPLIFVFAANASKTFLGLDRPISSPPSKSLDLHNDMDVSASIDGDSNFFGGPHPKSTSYKSNLGDPATPNSRFPINFPYPAGQPSAPSKIPFSLYTVRCTADPIASAAWAKPSTPPARRSPCLDSASTNARQLPK